MATDPAFDAEAKAAEIEAYDRRELRRERRRELTDMVEGSSGGLVDGGRVIARALTDPELSPGLRRHVAREAAEHWAGDPRDGDPRDAIADMERAADLVADDPEASRILADQLGRSVAQGEATGRFAGAATDTALGLDARAFAEGFVRGQVAPAERAAQADRVQGVLSTPEGRALLGEGQALSAAERGALHEALATDPALDAEGVREGLASPAFAGGPLHERHMGARAEGIAGRSFMGGVGQAIGEGVVGAIKGTVDLVETTGDALGRLPGAVGELAQLRAKQTLGTLSPTEAGRLAEIDAGIAGTRRTGPRHGREPGRDRRGSGWRPSRSGSGTSSPRGSWSMLRSRRSSSTWPPRRRSRPPIASSATRSPSVRRSSEAC